MFKFNPKKLIQTERVGRDPKSTVHPYQRHPSDLRWVVKHIYAKDSTEIITLTQSIVLGFSSNHTAIIPVKGYCIQRIKPKGYNIYIKLPRMKDNLCDFVKRQAEGMKGRPAEENVIKSLFHLANGLEYLHNRGVAHQNIKPSNILINEDDELKLADIGPGSLPKSQVLESGMVLQTESRFYTAPELLNQKGHIKKADKAAGDIWSLGVVFAEYCLLKQETINPHLNPKEIIVENLLNKVQKKYSSALVEILRKMLNIDSEKRISAMNLIKELKEKFSQVLGFKKVEIPAILVPEEKVQASVIQVEAVAKPKEIIVNKESEIETKQQVQPKPAHKDELKIDEKAKINSKIEEPEERKGRTETQETLEPKKRPRSHCAHQSESEISFTLTLTNNSLHKSDPEKLSTPKNSESKSVIVKSKENSQSLLPKDVKEKSGPASESVVVYSSGLGSKTNPEIKKELPLEEPKPMQRTIRPREMNKSFGGDLRDKFSTSDNQIKSYANFKTVQTKAQSDPVFVVSKKDMTKSENRENLKMSRGVSEKKNEDTTSGVSENIALRWDFAMKELFVKWLKTNFELRSEKTLQLNVSYSAESGYSFSKEELKELMENIIESTRKYSVDNISELRLSLDGCNKIEETEFEKLSVNVCQNLKIQKGLSLCFNRLYKVTDEGIKHLGILIGSNLKHIQSLNLAFTGSPIAYYNRPLTSLIKSRSSNTPLKITDEGLKHLVMSITQNLSGLKQLTLGFVACPNITDEGIYYLAVAIGSSLKDLQQLHLSFGRCEKVTDKGIAHLTTIINQNLTKIQKLTFGLWRTGVSDQSKDFLRKRLTKIPKVDIY